MSTRVTTGQAEALGQTHQALGLAVALGPGHAEVVLDPLGGVGALLVADHHHGVAVQAPQPAHNRAVLGVDPVAGQRREVVDQLGHVIGEMGPLGMARHLGLLPGVELGVGLLKQALGLGLEARDLLGDVDLAIVGQVAQLLDLAF